MYYYYLMKIKLGDVFLEIEEHFRIDGRKSVTSIKGRDDGRDDLKIASQWFKWQILVIY
jgi:hypothetical protein